MGSFMLKLEQDHIQKERESFQKILQRFLEVWALHPEEVREILGNWEDFLSLCLQESSAGLSYRPPFGDDISHILSWVSWFVGHEIWDDGDARILWIRREDKPLVAVEAATATSCFLIQGHDNLEWIWAQSKSLDLTDLRAALALIRSKKLRAQELREKMFAEFGGVPPLRDKQKSQTALLLEELLREISS